MSDLRLGEIDNYLLFGGGPILATYALYLKSEGISVTVITSPRHADETLEGAVFRDFLSSREVNYLVTANVGHNEEVVRLVTPTTVGLSSGAAWIFGPSFRRLFGGRLLNVHGARLPEGRGGGNYSWQILSGSPLGMCLIHQIDDGIDTGPIVKFSEFHFPASCRTPQDYLATHVERNLAFLKEFTTEVQSGRSFPLIRQVEYLSDYWPRLSTLDHGYLDWGWQLEDLERFILAFDAPYAGASTFLDGARVHLGQCLSDPSSGSFHPFQAGLVYRKTAQGLHIATRGGTLIVQAIRDVDGTDTMAKVKCGDRFHTPTKELERAKSYRAVYTSSGLKE